MAEFLKDSAVWGILLTIIGYGIGFFINRKTKLACFNPLLLGILFVILVLSLAKIPYEDYKASNAPLQYLLLPATVCLAVPLYENLSRLKGRFPAVLGGILAGVITSLGSILLMAWLLSMNKEQTATLIAKSVTTAIGIDVTQTLGGMVPLASAVIILTGITGNLTATLVCKIFRITDPVAKGVGIGTASHAIGTAKAFEIGELEGSVSSLSVAVAGILTAVLAPVAVNLFF